MLWLWWLLGCGQGRERVVVLAASSLTAPMDQAEALYEARHPDVDIVVSYAGSHTLARQVEQGLVGSVFASADGQLLQALANKGLAHPPQPLATNRLVLAAKGRVPELVELDEGATLVVGAPMVPVGRYAAQALALAEHDYHIVSFEPSVRRVTARVAGGEATLGVIYATELQTQAGASLRGRPIGKEVVVELSTLQTSPAGTAFAAFLRSDEVGEVFSSHGFGRP